jgi:hypothetical protein
MWVQLGVGGGWRTGFPNLRNDRSPERFSESASHSRLVDSFPGSSYPWPRWVHRKNRARGNPIAKRRPAVKRPAAHPGLCPTATQTAPAMATTTPTPTVGQKARSVLRRLTAPTLAGPRSSPSKSRKRRVEIDRYVENRVAPLIGATGSCSRCFPHGHGALPFEPATRRTRPAPASSRPGRSPRRCVHRRRAGRQ